MLVSLDFSCIGFQFHVNIAVDSVTVCFSEGAASEDGGRSSKVEDLSDPLADAEAIDL